MTSANIIMAPQPLPFRGFSQRSNQSEQGTSFLQLLQSVEAQNGEVAKTADVFMNGHIETEMNVKELLDMMKSLIEPLFSQKELEMLQQNVDQLLKGLQEDSNLQQMLKKLQDDSDFSTDAMMLTLLSLFTISLKNNSVHYQQAAGSSSEILFADPQTGSIDLTAFISSLGKQAAVPSQLVKEAREFASKLLLLFGKQSVTPEHTGKTGNNGNANSGKSGLLDGKVSTGLYELIQKLTAGQNRDGTDHKQVKFPLQQPVVFQPGPMHRLQQLELYTQLNTAADEGTLAGQFEKMITSSRLHMFRNGTAELHVKLYPEHLGSLSIKLISHHGEMIARITAETASAKSLIESQLHQLRHAFSSQQIHVDKIEVLQSQQPSLNHQQEGKGQERNNNNERDYSSQQSDQDESNDHEEDTFQSWLHALTV